MTRHLEPGAGAIPRHQPLVRGRPESYSSSTPRPGSPPSLFPEARHRASATGTGRTPMARITVVLLGVVCLGWNTPGVLLGQAQTFTVVRTIESELLADPFAVREGTGGVVFVSDPISKGIFRVSPSGEWTQIAREGQGPGELRAFGGLALCGDTLNAPDVAFRSVVRFKEDGQFLDVARVSVQAFPSPHYALVPALVLPEDRVLAVPAVFTDAMATGQVEEAPFVRYDRGGAMLDTLLLQPVAGTHVKLETGSGLRPSVRQPFLSRPEVAPDFRCQFLVLAEEVPAGLRLTWLMLADGERIVQEIPVDRVRLSRRDVDAELTRLSLNAERWGMQPARLESVYRRTVTIPDHEPVFTDVFAASGGYVWLRGFSTSEEVTWTRHSLRGDPVVQVALSRRDVIKDAAHDWLWIVRRGEFDVPRLVKLKVGG